MDAFTRSLARNLAPRGIRVSAVLPGPIWTLFQVVPNTPESAKTYAQ